MLSVMAKRKQSTKDDDSDGGGVLFIRLPEAVREAFERMLAEDPLRPKKQDIGLRALVAHLELNGYWPPKK
ncbi:hypothetical protein [Limnoglobus roseus]|uniref:Uncharacterized protein n=1 Tax=Limnoglobus roseus TaxID=2598579 RepID=A0A5C1AMQ9_9BACT|nr:hypothetical protein [Limnoglobus roseus]QEL19012.1 hypothetical protein PX52LOC_06063 [Limnoglobus roseus]